MKRLMILPIVLVALIFTSFAVLENGYSVGDKATDFKLKNVDGKYVSMSDNTDNDGYIVIFTCNTCPWAKGYEARIIELHEEYAPKGYPVIAIQPNDPQVSPGDSYDEMQKRAEEKDYPFPYLYDDTQEITIAYGATKTPHVYLVEKESEEYVVRYIGGIDDNPRSAEGVKVNYVGDAIESLIEGKEVETTSTKAIGCTIKWSEESKEKLGKS